MDEALDQLIRGEQKQLRLMGRYTSTVKKQYGGKFVHHISTFQFITAAVAY